MHAQRRRILFGGAAALTTAGLLLAAVPATAVDQPPPTAPVPSATEVVQATNAMMNVTYDRALLTGPLASAAFQTGYMIPPGGQDPYPVCDHGAGYNPIRIPDRLAVGYQASNGNVTQVEYVYPSAAAGEAAWVALSARIEQMCQGDWSDGDGYKKVTRKKVSAQGAAGAGWAVTTVMDLSTMHVVVRPVDGGIQSIVYYTQRDTTGSSTMKSSVPAAVNELSIRLADRWARRSTLPIESERMASWAVPAMLQPADVPAVLPVTTSADGGWANVNVSAPGSSVMTCGRDAFAGSWSFTSSLGGWGDVSAEPGALWQEVAMYQTSDAAQGAWREVRRAVLGCNETNPAGISAKRDINRTLSGTSELAYDGVPAVWFRTLSTSMSGTPDAFTTKAYRVYLLVDNTIQSLSYYESQQGLRQIPLDQLAVNTLAEQLADRWVTAASDSE